YPVSIHFGPPVGQPDDMHVIRQAVLKLGAAATQKSAHTMMTVTRRFLRSAKKRKRTSKVADTMGGDLTGGDALLRSLVVRRLLRRHVLAAEEQYVGVLLPPSV